MARYTNKQIDDAIAKHNEKKAAKANKANRLHGVRYEYLVQCRHPNATGPRATWFTIDRNIDGAEMAQAMAECVETDYMTGRTDVEYRMVVAMRCEATDNVLASSVPGIK